jgi:radical SAM superfamily enzyme YgiQ (UPF0313 family)
MNILLISPNKVTAPYPVYPIGLDYVAGAVPPGHLVRIADLNTWSREELAGDLERFAPGLIGISCRNIDNTESGDPLSFVNAYRELIQWLRERSSATIVCGGSGFTIMPEEMMARLGADYGVIGEGERFGLLVEAMTEGRDPAEIEGVLSSAIPDSPPPPWSGKQQRFATANNDHIQYYLDRGGMLNLQSKRGCSFSCIYCPYPHIEGRKHRRVAPGEVAGTALALEEAGARYLFFTDSAFNSDLEHSLAVARALEKAKLSIPWGGFFAPRPMPDDYFQVMAGSGLKHVEFGTESLSADMLRTYRKPFRPEDVFNAHHKALASGLHVAHYFLLGGPGESAVTVNESLDNIERLEKTVLFFFIGIRIYPGTGLYEMALKEGKIEDSTDLLQPVFYEASDIDRDSIVDMVGKRAADRVNWIIGSGGKTSADIIARMHERGYSGPLWEYLAR